MGEGNENRSGKRVRGLKLYDVKAVARFLDVSERRVRQLRDRRIFRRWADLAGGCDSGSPETRFPQAGNLFEVKGGKRNGY